MAGEEAVRESSGASLMLSGAWQTCPHAVFNQRIIAGSGLVMVQMQTTLDVADNSGAKTARCIKVLGGTRRRTASVGDVIVVSVQKAIAGSSIKSGTVVRGVIVRVRQPIRRSDGSYVRFDKNAIVLIDNDGNPRGTRIFGAVARELRERRYMKIVSLASEVV